MTNSMYLPTPSTDLEAYVKSVQQFPLLSEDEERKFALRYQRQQDLQAVWRLVTSHLRYVVRIARGYQGYGLPQEDLIQEGNIGLMKAVQRFDPMVGVRLASFAVHWIRAEIHEFVLRNWRIVKVATTKAQRKLFFNLRRTKKRLGWLTRTEALEIAEDLRVRVEDVFEMEQRLQAHDEPFDGAGDNEDDRPSPATLLGDSRYEPAGTLEAAEWTEFVTERVLTTLETLDERSRNIVTRRWLRQPKAKLRELAAQYGISAERVRQIEAQAFAVLRAAALAGAGVGRTVEGKPRARKRREPPTQTDSAAPEQMSVGHSGQEQERPANPLARTPRALLSRPGKQRSGARQNGARQNTPPTASRKPRPRRKVISLRSQRGASLIG